MDLYFHWSKLRAEAIDVAVTSGTCSGAFRELPGSFLTEAQFYGGFEKR